MQGRNKAQARNDRLFIIIANLKNMQDATLICHSALDAESRNNSMDSRFRGNDRKHT